MAMKKTAHNTDFRLEHGGLHWTVDIATWRDDEDGTGELRVYRIHGDVTTPLLREGLEALADVRGLQLAMDMRIAAAVGST